MDGRIDLSLPRRCEKGGGGKDLTPAHRKRIRASMGEIDETDHVLQGDAAAERGTSHRRWLALFVDSRRHHSTLLTFDVLGGEWTTITQFVRSVSLENYGRMDQIFHCLHRITLTRIAHDVGRRLPTPSKRMSREKKKNGQNSFFFKKKYNATFGKEIRFGSTSTPSFTHSYIIQTTRSKLQTSLKDGSQEKNIINREKKKYNAIHT